jgi:ribose transport system ATP-binding protein
MTDLLLTAQGITKTFPGVVALDNASFDLRAGEVHVLFGENGAGKSTLIKILSGSYPPDQGEIRLKGRKVVFRNPYEARQQGLSAVYQEFSLVPQLTVLENLFLGAEMVRWGFLSKAEMATRAKKSLQELGFHLDLFARVGQLNRAARQMTEIAKAFQNEISVLILDEPTASLSDREVAQLFRIIRRLTHDGVGVIYISHRLDELKKIGDRITVLRDGKNVGTLEMAKAVADELIAMMTGRRFDDVFPSITHQPGERLLRVEDLCTAAGLEQITFDLHAGEILGVAGLVGSGKSRVGRALFGLDRIYHGQIAFAGRRLKRITPRRSIERGIIYSPADRHKEGLVLCRSVKENQTLVSLPLFERFGFIDRRREVATATQIVNKMNIRPADIHQIINYLSGGNQQKVVLARGLTRKTRLFIFDEASCGVDVGAKHEIYRFLKEQAEQGAAILYISSEIPEVLNLSHRIMVMHNCTVAAILERSQANEEKILSHCFGYGSETASRTGPDAAGPESKGSPAAVPRIG